jgi:hypothetical protein
MRSENASGVEIARLVSHSRVMALDESKRTVTHVVSTGALDRSNRMVEPAGWKLAKFRSNPVVMADHNYTLENIIGRSLSTKIEGDALVSTTEFAAEGLGNVAFRLVQAGLANSWSVGWIGLKSHMIGEHDDCPACTAAVKRKKIDYGTHYVEQELLEYSLVAIPANPEAVMGLQVAGLIGSAEADAWVTAAAAIVRDPEPQPEEPEPDTDPDDRIARSAEFYKELFAVSRNFARRRATLQCSQQIRRLA